MSATVVIAETNGATVVTEDPANVNMGSIDAAALDPVANPITPGANSFEKWHRIHVSAMGGSSKIDNLQVWASAGLAANATHKTNARTGSYAGAETYAAASATDRSATYHYSQTMPTADPGAANLGIGGALAGSITVAGYSDYLVSQIQTTGSAVAGTSITMNYQYDETA